MKHFIYNVLDIGYQGITDTKNTDLTNPKGYMIFVRGDRTSTVASGTNSATILRSKGLLISGHDIPTGSTSITASMKKLKLVPVF